MYIICIECSKICHGAIGGKGICQKVTLLPSAYIVELVRGRGQKSQKICDVYLVQLYYSPQRLKKSWGLKKYIPSPKGFSPNSLLPPQISFTESKSFGSTQISSPNGIKS